MKVNHEITPVTLAVVAKELDGRQVTQILEDGEVFYVKKSPGKVIDLACKFFGSSLKGRQDGTRDICGITHKAPIAIDPSSGMYFFPTSSPQNPQCAWIAHSHIDQIIRSSIQETQIIFKNGQSVTVEVSHGSLLNQVQRTAQYRYLLDNRIKYILKSNVDMVAEPFAWRN
ncbi:competence protein [Aquibacillus halophilus]|uniref:Competence protein n=1 Tax=Aquibacillus halophilus TaxID=930132 RepID=A0A6A8DMC2_9BACI|nr:competence protein ComK [Aquibacillus halophilus]MRH44167.1 competence protein [Aquibacillus halophilus]